eukprot:844143-Prymnesium_polylepis.1
MLALKKQDTLALKATLAGEAEVISSQRTSLEQDLDKAMPALEKAQKALKVITAKDIGLLKKLKQPPDLVKRVFDVVLIFFQKDI